MAWGDLHEVLLEHVKANPGERPFVIQLRVERPAGVIGHAQVGVVDVLVEAAPVTGLCVRDQA